MHLIDLKPRLESLDVQDLLYELVGWRDDDALNRAALERSSAAYRQDASQHLYGTFREGRLAGLIGLETAASPHLHIRHLVVYPAYRGTGVGRELIEAVWNSLKPVRLSAETDASAVGFYRRCGFSAQSLGEKYPGVERFLCLLEP